MIFKTLATDTHTHAHTQSHTHTPPRMPTRPHAPGRPSKAMAWLGKILGGALGFALGGPLAANNPGLLDADCARL